MEKEILKELRETIKNFLEYLDLNGYEINENGDAVPKNINKQLSLELKDEE